MFSVHHGVVGGKRSLLLQAALLLLGARMALAAAVIVTITQQAPMESVSATGDITGVKEGEVGAQYTLVSTAGDQVTLQDSTGLYRIAISATNYVPPPPAPAAPAAAPAPASAPSTTTATAPAAPAPATAPVSASSASSSSPPASTPLASSPPAQNAAPMSQDDVEKINTGLGKSVFSTQSFWSEPALVIAQRLGLDLEGRTKWETSYRKYFSGDSSDKDAAMLGSGAYCVALYADADDHPTSLLIAFANDGDYKKAGWVQSDILILKNGVTDAHRFFPDKSLDQLQQEYDGDVAAFEPARQAEMETLTKNLTSLFGDAKNATFGDDPATREDIKRWDWNDVSFLLTGQENKYNLLRIVPTALADNNGRTERISRQDIGVKLSGAVEHRPNGDVIITQIPMADQGPKGYCVPATWERVLRYEGVPGDMYTLSRVGSTKFGGGTWGGDIAQQLDDTLHNYGRHCEFLNIDILDAVSVRHYIDDGVPIFWSLNPAGYDAPKKRYALADRNKEWDRWKTLLANSGEDSAYQRDKLPDLGGHQVLIIGYNPDTKEIAWTDPWGRDTSERWMTEKEAQRCSLNQYYIISW